jgi:hypothetical protein
MMGLFLMARDANGSAICVIHTVVMASVLALTAVFHYHTCRVFDRIIDFLPISSCESIDSCGELEVNKEEIPPENHNRSNKNGLKLIHEENEPNIRHTRASHGGGHYMASVNTFTADNIRTAGQVVRKRSMRSLSEIMSPAVYTTTAGPPQQRYRYWHGIEASNGITNTNGAGDPNAPHNAAKDQKTLYAAQDFHALSPEQRAHLVARSFHHVALRAPTPCLWVPRDASGVAEDQIRDVRTNYPHILISADGCELDPVTAKIRINRVPPDYDSTINLRL